MAANRISTLPTKQERQLAKLDIAQARRQGYADVVENTTTYTSVFPPTLPSSNTEFAYGKIKITVNDVGAVYLQFQASLPTITNQLTVGTKITIDWDGRPGNTVATIAGPLIDFPGNPYPGDPGFLLTVISTTELPGTSEGYNIEAIAVPNGRFIGTGTNVTTATYYREYNVYNINLLADKYTSNTTTVHTTSTLVETRPWMTGPLGSLQFSGANYLSVAGSTNTAMGTGDFTWETWVYPTSSSGYQAFIDTRTNPLGGGDTTGFYFGTNNNTLTPIYYTNSLQLASSVDLTLNAWNHVALVRISGTVTLWVNGASGGSKVDSTNLTEQRVFIGSGGLGLYLTGRISNLRIVKGTAVYTTAFTPTVGPLTAISNTVLLLKTTNDANYLKDSSTNNFTVTNNGSITSSALSPF